VVGPGGPLFSESERGAPDRIGGRFVGRASSVLAPPGGLAIWGRGAEGAHSSNNGKRYSITTVTKTFSLRVRPAPEGAAAAGPHVPTPYENLLYHYTDAGALLSMVTKRQFWATPTDFKNDLSEYAQPITRLSSFVKDPELFVPWVQGKPDKYLQALRLQLDTNQTVVTISFSKHANSLTQFRMYGPPGGGYGIGFPREYLARIPQLSILDCDYSHANLDEWCMSYIQEFFAHAERLDDGSLDAQQLHGAIWSNTDLFSRRLEAQLKFKADEFSAEDEVRLYKFGPYTKHRVSHGGNLIIPYEPLDLPNDEIPVKIICGPNRDPGLANRSCWELIAAGRAAGTRWQFDASGYHSQFRV
jgi:hypothetical protein